MQTVTFYGSSDDNFCCEGYERDEWGAYGHPRQVKVTPPEGAGLVVEGEYSPKGYDGKWRVRVVGEVPSQFKITHEAAKNDDDDYTDRLTVTGPIAKVMPILLSEELGERLADFDWKRLDDETQIAVAQLLGIQ